MIEEVTLYIVKHSNWAAYERYNGEIDLRELEVNIVHSGEELQAKVYPNFENKFRKAEWLWDRTILAAQ